jgi:hypothetical protein
LRWSMLSSSSTLRKPRCSAYFSEKTVSFVEVVIEQR